MRFNLRAFARYRPRVLTVGLLIVIATLLVLANLSDEIRPRHHEVLQPSAELIFEANGRDGPNQGSVRGSLLNVSYGWPLLWRQYVIMQDYGGMSVLGECDSRNRLVENLFLWLSMLTAPAAACEWVLRRYRLRLRWSLRTMLIVVGIVAILCSWFAGVRKRVVLEDEFIASVNENYGEVGFTHLGPKWLDVVGAERLRRRVSAVEIGYRADLLERDGVFRRLGHLPELQYFDVKCVAPGMVDALRRARHMRYLSIAGFNELGWDDEALWRECFAAIGQMPQLERLHLETAIGSDSLACWAGLVNLKSLTLNDVYTKGPPLLNRLPCLPNLEDVDLRDSEIGDQDLRYLAALPALKSLNLIHTDITDAGMAELSASESLEELCIDADTVSPAVLESLLGVKHLKRLHIYGDPHGLEQADPEAFVELSLDRGCTVLVANRDLYGCEEALEKLWRSKPGIIIDSEYERPPWTQGRMESLGYETVGDALGGSVHRLLRDWKEQQSAP